LVSGVPPTNDLDLLFVPFTSKNEILPELRRDMSEVEGVESKISADSKCIRCLVRYGQIQIQIEATIAESCEYESISAISQGTPILLAAQRRDIALAHKLGAWNERHLMRDHYDLYFFVSVLNVMPDMGTLRERLLKVFSGRTNRSKAMALPELIAKLKQARNQLSDKVIKAELGAILSRNELAGLDLKIKEPMHQF
jgi:hypothetical protein